MQVGGIEIPDKLPNQFVPSGTRILLMDGDAACYEAANKYVNLDTAVRAVHMKILEAMFLTNCKTARVHITPVGCKKAGRTRLLGVKPYQANRKGREKPKLLEPLRQSLQGLLKDNNITIIPNYEVEADDGLVIESYALGDKGLMYSADKDLRLCIGPYYDRSTGRVDILRDPFGYISIGSSLGTGITRHPEGHGRKFFWWQMLMGDPADNVKGLLSKDGKRVGLVKGFELIDGITSEVECATKVLSWYKEINQNPFPEAYALWLLRSPRDSFAVYLSELAPDLPEDLLVWLRECYRQKWRL